VFYILFHMWMTRFNPLYLHGNAYDFVHNQIANPAVFAFYVIGVLSACWHFGNGLFGFSIHWGLATGRKAQDMVSKLSLAVAIVLAVVALNALFAFAGHGFYPQWLTKPHATEQVGVTFQGGQR
jgi:succinate dehydrogenase / fumarate reductase cytochrome b subunit